MVVHNFDFRCVPVEPIETDSPLVIDANGMLSLAIAFEFFQPISRGRPKVEQSMRIIDHSQFPQGRGLDFPWKLFREKAMIYLFRLGILE